MKKIGKPAKKEMKRNKYYKLQHEHSIKMTSVLFYLKFS